MFFVDMHCHSTASDDARATVEQYLKWIQVLRRRGYRIDAIVLTEHRRFVREPDYSALSREYGVLVMKGAELETRCGHFLVYGVNERLLKAVDFSDVALDAVALVKEARNCGAIAIPAHPGRPVVGFCEFVDRGLDFSDIRIVETLSGSARRGENERALELARERNYLGIGGSDAHLASAVATCLTAFHHPVRNERELVEALLSGEFRAMYLEETAKGVAG